MIICNLDKILEQQMLKRSDLIRMSGISACKIYRLAQNKMVVIDLEMIEQICSALEISTDELFINKKSLGQFFTKILLYINRESLYEENFTWLQ